MATGDQEEVYTLLLTDIDKGAVDDDIVKASLYRYPYLCSFAVLQL